MMKTPTSRIPTCLIKKYSVFPPRFAKASVPYGTVHSEYPYQAEHQHNHPNDRIAFDVISNPLKHILQLPYSSFELSPPILVILKKIKTCTSRTKQHGVT
jgi:hypothetical protein